MSGRDACGRRGVWGQRTWVHASLRGFQRWWNECLQDECLQTSEKSTSLGVREPKRLQGTARGHRRSVGLSWRSYANTGQTTWPAANASGLQRGQLLECGGGHSGAPCCHCARTASANPSPSGFTAWLHGLHTTSCGARRNSRAWHCCGIGLQIWAVTPGA